MKTRFAYVLSYILFFSFLSIGCSKDKRQTNWEPIQNMIIGPNIKSQDHRKSSESGAGMLKPPAGTVPMGKKPYPYKGQPETAGKNLKNPLVGLTPEEERIWSDKGASAYGAYCALCHGSTGRGDGQIAPKMSIKPPTLLSNKVNNFSDGRIFHIITDGQGVMGSYALQMSDWKTRWAVVNYIRGLQKLSASQNSSVNPNATDN